VEGDPVADAQPSGIGRQLALAEVAAVDIEPDPQVRPLGGQPGETGQGDIELVGRLEGTRVDDPDLAILGKRASRLGTGIEERQ